MHKHELIPKLERTALFSEFKRDDYEALVDYLTVQKIEAGILVFREGERGTRMCLLLEGRLEVFKRDDSGTDKKITDVGPGKLIGEMSLIDGMAYSATVISSAPRRWSCCRATACCASARSVPASATNCCGKSAICSACGCGRPPVDSSTGSEPPVITLATVCAPLLRDYQPP